MKIAVIDDEGNVVDTYDEVTSADVSSPVFDPALNQWMRLTLLKAELAVTARLQRAKDVAARLEANAKLFDRTKKERDM